MDTGQRVCQCRSRPRPTASRGTNPRVASRRSLRTEGRHGTFRNTSTAVPIRRRVRRVDGTVSLRSASRWGSVIIRRLGLISVSGPRMRRRDWLRLRGIFFALTKGLEEKISCRKEGVVRFRADDPPVGSCGQPTPAASNMVTKPFAKFPLERTKDAENIRHWSQSSTIYHLRKYFSVSVVLGISWCGSGYYTDRRGESWHSIRSRSETVPSHQSTSFMLLRTE